MTRIAESSGSRSFGDSPYIKKFAKQMLKNSMFLGIFQEKRFVEPVNSYRDVVNVFREEEEFIKNLQAVKKRIEEHYLKRPWIGITYPDDIGAPAGYSLWVVLPEEVFGMYWYRVKTVEFLDNEIRLKLDIVRPYQRECTPSKSVSSEVANDSREIDFKSYFEHTLQDLKYNFLNFSKDVLTFHNIKNTVIFISLLISTCIAGCVNIIQYLMDYILKLVRELSFLIKVSTPVIINFINLLGKAIFGFYHMIVVLFQGRPPQVQPVYNSYFTLDPQKMLPGHMEKYDRHFTRGLPYPSRRSGPTITPLN